MEAKGLQTSTENSTDVGVKKQEDAVQSIPREGGSHIKCVKDVSFESHIATLAVAGMFSRYQLSGMPLKMFALCYEHSHVP